MSKKHSFMGIIILIVFILTNGYSIGGQSNVKTSDMALLEGVWSTPELDKIKYFGPVEMYLDNALTKVGLVNSDFEKIATEKYQEYFKNIRTITKDESSKKLGDAMFQKPDEKYGHVTITIHTLVSQHSVVYHIRLAVGTGFFTVHSYVSHFGYASKAEIPNIIKELIDKQMKEFSKAFYANRKKQ